MAARFADMLMVCVKSLLFLILIRELCKRMMKQLLNSALAKYRDMSVARRSIISLCLRHWQLIDLVTTGHKSRYFVKICSIIDKYTWYHFFMALCGS